MGCRAKDREGEGVALLGAAGNLDGGREAISGLVCGVEPLTGIGFPALPVRLKHRPIALIGLGARSTLLSYASLLRIHHQKAARAVIGLAIPLLPNAIRFRLLSGGPLHHAKVVLHWLMVQGSHLLRRPCCHGMLLMAHIWQWCAAHAVVSKKLRRQPAAPSQLPPSERPFYPEGHRGMCDGPASPCGGGQRLRCARPWCSHFKISAACLIAAYPYWIKAYTYWIRTAVLTSNRSALSECALVLPCVGRAGVVTRLLA